MTLKDDIRIYSGTLFYRFLKGEPSELDLRITNAWLAERHYFTLSLSNNPLWICSSGFNTGAVHESLHPDSICPLLQVIAKMASLEFIAFLNHDRLGRGFWYVGTPDVPDLKGTLTKITDGIARNYMETSKYDFDYNLPKKQEQE